MSSPPPPRISSSPPKPRMVSLPPSPQITSSSNMLRAVAQALGSSSSPGEVLAQVNETLLARIPANMFVTCFYAIVEDESGRLLYANAGHNLPCCRRDDGHAAAMTTTDLSVRGMPLGIMPQMNYEEKESVLVPGEQTYSQTLRSIAVATLGGIR